MLPGASASSVFFNKEEGRAMSVGTCAWYGLNLGVRDEIHFIENFQFLKNSYPHICILKLFYFINYSDTERYSFLIFLILERTRVFFSDFLILIFDDARAAEVEFSVGKSLSGHDGNKPNIEITYFSTKHDASSSLQNAIDFARTGHAGCFSELC